MTQLVPVTVSKRLALKERPLSEVAEALLDGGLPTDEAPDEFPAMPTPLTATSEIRKALKVLSTTFNQTIVIERRALTTEEIAAIGVEYSAIQDVVKLLGERAEQVKEIVRTHQDVTAEEAGTAFPFDVTRNGNVIAPATERDVKGHYILAAKGQPNDVEIPGTTLKFSTQFSSGRTTENLAAIQEMFENGEIDEKAYKAMTVVKRVPDADKVKAYVLKTGEVSILSRIVKRGRNSTSFYLRALKKK